MKIVRAAPEQRLPNLVQDPDRYGYANLMVNLARYACPHCGEFTVFAIAPPDPSPFHDAVRSEFDKLTTTRSIHEQGIADFECRKCSRPVRVVFRFSEFQMATFYYFAEAVFETAA